MNSHTSTLPSSHVEHMGVDRSRCGYCRSHNSSHNYGVWAHRLDVNDYQNLLDAGWRRSGNYLYRPNLLTTCCPTYVIRLDAHRFKPSTTHKRVLKRLHSYSIESPRPPTRPRPSPPSNPSPAPPAPLIEAISTAVSRLHTHPDIFPPLHPCAANAPGLVKVFPSRSLPVKRKPRSTHVPAPAFSLSQSPDLSSNAALALAAAERCALVHKNCAGKADVAERVARQMCLAQALARCLEGVVECVRAVSVTEPGFLNFWLRNDKDHHETPSDDPGNGRRDNINCNNFENRSGLHTMQRSGRKTLPGLPLTDVTGLQVVGHTVPTPEYSHDSTADHSGQIHDVLSSPAILTEFSEGSSFSMELVPSRFQAEAYEIFRKYQMTVHRELPGQCNEDAYRRFLVDSPLTKSHSSSSPDHWYGSFHMLYRLAGRLFAVGVVDVLPRCLSSVYLFYDPEFAKLSPGILSALKEIEWVRRCNSAYPSLRFYYMGYYIHSCAKMRYKASFYPSEILCESTKNWIPASAARAVLDLKGERTLRLAPPNMKPAPEASNFEIEDEEATILANESNLQIMFIHGGARLVSLQTLDAAVGRQCPEKIEMIREKLRTFVRLVGKASSKVFMHIL